MTKLTETPELATARENYEAVLGQWQARQGRKGDAVHAAHGLLANRADIQRRQSEINSDLARYGPAADRLSELATLRAEMAALDASLADAEALIAAWPGVELQAAREVEAAHAALETATRLFSSAALGEAKERLYRSMAGPLAEVLGLYGLAWGEIPVSKKIIADILLESPRIEPEAIEVKRPRPIPPRARQVIETARNAELAALHAESMARLRQEALKCA